MMPVPIGYEHILRVKYGDYTVITNHTSSHDYPVYKKQLEKLREVYNRFEEAAAKDEAAAIEWKKQNRHLLEKDDEQVQD